MDADKIASFSAATGAEASRAEAFLAAFNGDVDAAVNAFFEDGDFTMADAVPPAQVPAAAPPPTATTAGAPKPAAKPRNAGNVRSLADLAGDGDDSDEDRPVETFIGGAKSGQMVQDPKQAKGGEDRVSSLFDSARKAGALDGNLDDLRAQQNKAAGSKAFAGQGRTLSGAPGPSAAPPAPQQGAGAAPGPLTPIVHTISFYRNGFVVNDGPLRSFDDPANAPFMEAIASGMAPEELRPKNPMQPINVNLVRKDEMYTPPPEPKYKAFTGAGHTLGGSSGSSDASAVPVAQMQVKPGSWTVDESKPTTTLQLRLLDGQRMVAKFNTHHTVGHIRAFIESVRPGTGHLGSLLAGMPPSTLADESVTLAEAGLLGCVVTQKA